MEAAAEGPTPTRVEEAGPLTCMIHDFPGTLPPPSHLSPSQNPDMEETAEQSGQQPLESHEVVELQAFSERKEWIMEKIKLLEGMPPIELFADLDAIRASTPVVSGLPTREQLEQWLVEHNKVEKETEIFDSGELKKFKNFTMAVSKRNLSPQDTDIIELTLTTIYEFDKLLHLLRERAENLDLLGVRLTWEEQRCAAWADHRQLLLDLQSFLVHRARWSPSVYDALPQVDAPAATPAPPPTLSRRGSATSLASECSSSFPSGFSRGARFKQAEALSREAAQFAGRISSLRHGKITTAGKALDRLIERKRVPDELLDEQDNLEEQGINEMENVGRFIMSAVTQWRKADEIYVETMKDQTLAQYLLDDIEAALLAHPSPRQDTIFSSRTSSIIKRLSCRENPSSSFSGFLRPTHSLFPDQPSANDTITKVLGEELEVALSLTKRLERSALEYHAACDAVRKAEQSVSSANELSSAYDSTLHSILNGVESSDGDGSPPDLTSESCLRETKHAAFLAFLPSFLQQLDKSDKEARIVLPVAQASLLGLTDINLEPGFKDRLTSAIQRLDAGRAESERVRVMMAERVSLLRDTRKIWVSAGSILTDLGAIREDTGDLMERQKWKSNITSQSQLPPTPESFDASLPSSTKTLANATEQTTVLRERFDRDVHAGISALPRSIGPGLRLYLVKRRDVLLAILEHTQQMTRLADRVNKQALAMTAIRDETHDFEVRLEDANTRFDALAEQILDASSSDDSLDTERQELVSDATSIQAACQTFMDGLPHRVIFVSSDASNMGLSRAPNPSSRRRRASSLDLTLENLEALPLLEPLIDPAHLDHAVRTDCNAFALHLATGVSSLQQKMTNLDVVLDARAVDLKLVALKELVVQAEGRHQTLRETVFALPGTIDTIDLLARTAGEAGLVFDTQRSEISQSFPPIRQLLHKMDAVCHESPANRHLCLSRSQALDNLEAEFHAWSDNTKALLSDIRHREERLRAAQREQIKREQERLEAEAVEKLRREQAESEERRLQLEREREEAEAAERLHREQVEAEERMRAKGKRAEAKQTWSETELPSSQAFPSVDDDDTFPTEDNLGSIGSPELSCHDLTEVQTHVAELRSRLRSLGIKSATRPSPSSASPLLTVGRHATMVSQLTEVSNDALGLPASTSNIVVDSELKSLQDELHASHQLLPRALSLARFGSLVKDGDNALSDLLEHIDSYPAPPSGPLAASYVSSSMLPPEEQLNGRLAFTKSLVDKLEEEFDHVSSEPKASSERERVVQTWTELESMALDRINGRRSRPPSTLGSGRNSRASVAGHRPMVRKRSSDYSALSVNSAGRGRGHVVAPAHPSTSSRRTSHKADPAAPNRSVSRLSVVSTNRSVSGPMASSSRLFSSTFASRQRTTSLSSTVSSPNSNNPAASRRSIEPSHPHPLRAIDARRAASPTPSEVSVVSRSVSGARRLFPSWGPPPPLPSSSNLRKSTPHSIHKLPMPSRKLYVANPKSKLDVAVGDVVNKLPVDVDIKVEVAQDTWQDKSGKYWIGGEEPKLCFCRILRSQTVMVRVGGGWMELSKFIETHFADMFRLLPEPMPYVGSREEKWISSSTLLEAPELTTTPPRDPKTPEPGSGSGSSGMLLPSFALSSPSGKSPQSMKTHSSPGSPLTAIQFLRRIDGEDSFLRPGTPLKSSPLRNQSRASLLPAALKSPSNRVPVWKP